jgi:hypothetical protein
VETLGGGFRLSLAFAVSGDEGFFRRPKSRPRAPRKVDFLRWGFSLLLPECSVPDSALMSE